MKTLAGIIATLTGIAASIIWLIAIWSNQQTGQWIGTAILLTFVTWVVGIITSEIY